MTKKFLGNIDRRDFLNGMALTGAAGAMLSPMELMANMGAAPEEYYPPSKTGLRGSHVGSFEVAHSVSWQGKDWGTPKDQTDDVYDMVVVGGGISGLSAAFLYQQKTGGGKKVLILDNHDDFGGHAKRNEFDIDGKKVIGYGGSQTIMDPGKYSPEAKKLLKDISIETDRFNDYFDQDFYKKWNMSSHIYFSKKDYGKDLLIRNPFSLDEAVLGEVDGGFGPAERMQKIREFPISREAQDSIIQMVSNAKDHFTDLTTEEKMDKLRSITYTDYLQQYYHMPKDATDIFRDSSKAVWAVGWDALSALEAVRLGMPGTWAYEDVSKRVSTHIIPTEPYISHFPDGNAGVARSLVRKLNPQAVPGNTMEDLVQARVNYDLLDQEHSDVRIRLNSTAVDVKHTADQKHVDVTYVRDNLVYRVRGKHVIMACYNSLIPYICSEVPDKQVEAINYATKSPLVYTSILLRNWQAFAELGCKEVSLPLGKYHQDYSLDFPVSMGDYEFSNNPDQPIILHATCIPTVPDQGYSVKEQYRLGRYRLYEHTFEEFENSIKEDMSGMLKGSNFNAERDIAAITVNRWPHGYAYEYLDIEDDKDFNSLNGPHIAGRAQIGRISIANSDASALAYVNGAIDAAVRAVSEQIKV